MAFWRKTSKKKGKTGSTIDDLVGGKFAGGPSNAWSPYGRREELVQEPVADLETGAKQVAERESEVDLGQRHGDEDADPARSVGEGGQSAKRTKFSNRQVSEMKSCSQNQAQGTAKETLRAYVGVRDEMGLSSTRRLVGLPGENGEAVQVHQMSGGGRRAVVALPLLPLSEPSGAMQVVRPQRSRSQSLAFRRGMGQTTTILEADAPY